VAFRDLKRGRVEQGVRHSRLCKSSLVLADSPAHLSNLCFTRVPETTESDVLFKKKKIKAGGKQCWNPDLGTFVRWEKNKGKVREFEKKPRVKGGKVTSEWERRTRGLGHGGEAPTQLKIHNWRSITRGTKTNLFIAVNSNVNAHKAIYGKENDGSWIHSWYRAEGRGRGESVATKGVWSSRPKNFALKRKWGLRTSVRFKCRTAKKKV